MSPANAPSSKPFELLHTKLVIPTLRFPTLPRGALLARLEAGLKHKLILLSAPAGYGKTTLASQWLSAGDNRTPAAWVSLDSGEDDPLRFWSYVFAATQSFGEGIGRSALDLLNSSPTPPLESLLAGWINELAQVSGEAVLVLEDYQAITSAQIHEAVSFLIERLPHRMHLVILTRSAAGLPLARLRAHNQVLELRDSDLRFSADETRRFLDLSLPFSLSEEAATCLADRTEGWPSGLRLAAAALLSEPDPEQRERLVASLSGSHPSILAYFTGEVLEGQPAEVQEFLLQTSILDRLSGPLCDEIVTTSERCNDSTFQRSNEILDYLERANLFIFPLDSRRQWFRYHPLFAEALRHTARRRYGVSFLRELHQRASLWYEQHDFLPEAVESALSAGRFIRAAGLIEEALLPRLAQKERRTLRRWLERLPEQVLRAHPNLAFYASIALPPLQRTSPAGFEPLSQQEQRVLGLLVSGLSYKEIAQELVVSINTVKTHVKGVYRKLNVGRRREARELVQRLNLL